MQTSFGKFIDSMNQLVLQNLEVHCIHSEASMGEVKRHNITFNKHEHQHNDSRLDLSIYLRGQVITILAKLPAIYSVF